MANNGSGSPTGPKAFVTMLLFDNNFNFVEATFDQIDPELQTQDSTGTILGNIATGIGGSEILF